MTARAQALSGRPLLAERALVALFAVIALMMLGLAGCSRDKPAAAAVDSTDLVPGLIDVELRGQMGDRSKWTPPTALGGVRVVEDERVSNGALEDLGLAEDRLVELEVEPAREAEVLLALRARDDVVFAEPVVRLSASWLPDDPDFSKQWHLKAAGAPAAWDATRGAGVTVAVIDTGIAAVDDLDAHRLLRGHNFVANSDDARDDHGHGTHVAGTIAQSTGNGVGVAGMAPEANLLPLKVLSASGSGTSVAISDAIRYAVDHGARVLNLSLGGGGRSRAMEEAVAYARRKGAVVVCAAGNTGSRGVSFPAAYDGAFAVSAVGPGGRAAPYTSFGPEVRLAGPGGDKSQGEEAGVLQETVDPTTGKGVYRWFQGTSMATPHVAGAAALLESVGVTNPGAVESILAGTAAQPGSYLALVPAREAQPVHPGSAADLYGAGLLDAAAAVRRATLWFGLWRLAFAAVGALLALRHARALGQIKPRERAPALLVPALLVSSGALAALAPLGFARLPWGTLFALPPAALAQHWLGLPGTSAAATLGAWLGYSALLPFALALVARAARPLRGLAAGVAFGWAGMLLHAAIFRTVALPWLPTPLAVAYLMLGSLLAWWAGRGSLAKEALR